jgi:hypothetical protein
MKPLSSAEWWTVYQALISVNYPANPSVHMPRLREKALENYTLAIRREAMNA